MKIKRVIFYPPNDHEYVYVVGESFYSIGNENRKKVTEIIEVSGELKIFLENGEMIKLRRIPYVLISKED